MALKVHWSHSKRLVPAPVRWLTTACIKSSSRVVETSSGLHRQPLASTCMYTHMNTHTVTKRQICTWHEKPCTKALLLPWQWLKCLWNSGIELRESPTVLQMLRDRKHSPAANSPITKETYKENKQHLILFEVCKEFSHITQSLQPYKAHSSNKTPFIFIVYSTNRVSYCQMIQYFPA